MTCDLSTEFALLMVISNNCCGAASDIDAGSRENVLHSV